MKKERSIASILENAMQLKIKIKNVIIIIHQTNYGVNLVNNIKNINKKRIGGF